MGKKVKVGKQRRDKYYHLAKESGYRSRAAFKLVQLNKKYEFLQRSQVLVDLCAAPGGWLQVANQFMPISSLVIGVDLAPIKPIANVITLQDDITKDSCRKAIQLELKTRLADCVLHDGAPNVGQNWVHDAFMQAQLTLSALKLASTVLRKGGWFVTKVFRSKDYPAIITTLGKLFSKVHVTKPAASRTESAEIFVVCQYFLKPDNLDRSLLDSRNVFEDTVAPSIPRLSMFGPEKSKKAKAEGYEEGKLILRQVISATDFALSNHCLELLSQATEINIDSSDIADHASTTCEIKEHCRDVKVLGRREIRELLAWRKQIRHLLISLRAKQANDADEDAVKPIAEVDEATLLENEVSAAKIDELKEFKRKKRKLLKEKQKMREKIKLKMVFPGDRPDFPDLDELFDISKIQAVMQLKSTTDDVSASVPSKKASSSEFLRKADIAQSECFNGNYKNLCLMDDAPESANQTTKSWFSRQAFDGLITEEDEEYDFNQLSKRSKGHESKSAASENRVLKSSSGIDELKEDDICDKSESQSMGSAIPQAKLEPEGLALAEELVHSSRSRQHLIDWSYHRFMNNDDNLPGWFADDEKKHCRKPLPVSKERIEVYKAMQKEINARPIAKVVEAKARKKKRAVQRLEKMRKKAEAVTENPDTSNKEKNLELKKLAKQAKELKKPNVTYIVAKKGQAGKRVRRPRGVSGQFKVVDPRMKKDIRKLKKTSKHNNQRRK